MKKEVKEESDGLFNKYTLILFGIFLLIGIMFYISLSIVKSGNGASAGTAGVVLSPEEKSEFSFGIKEIIFALSFAFLMTGFLIWTRSIIIKNAYLGGIIGIICSGVLGYAFYLRYRGLYSLVFMIITGAVVISYLGKNFIKYKKENYVGEEEE